MFRVGALHWQLARTNCKLPIGHYRCGCLCRTDDKKKRNTHIIQWNTLQSCNHFCLSCARLASVSTQPNFSFFVVVVVLRFRNELPATKSVHSLAKHKAFRSTQSIPHNNTDTRKESTSIR